MGFKLFGLRVQVHSTGYSLRSCADRKWGWSVDNVIPRRDGLRIWKILKKIQLGSDHYFEKLGSDHGVEKLKSNHRVEG